MKVFNSAGEVVYGPAQPLMFYQTPYSATAQGGPFIPDLGGQVTLQLTGAGQDDLVVWGGQNDGGQLVAGGIYMVQFQTSGPTGDPITLQVPVTVIRQQAISAVTIYNSAGELVRHFSTGLSSLTGLTLSQGSFVAGFGSVTLTTGALGSPTVAWDGLNDAGQAVAPGLYDIKVTKSAPGAADIQFSAWVQVLGASGRPLDGLVAGPNPLRPGDDALRLSMPNLPADATLKLGLYTVDGELVYAHGGAAAGTVSLPVRSSLASGIYVLVVEARTSALSQRRMIRVAVLR
jgi:hypothetical protein